MTEEQQFEKYPVTQKDVPTQKTVSAEPKDKPKGEVRIPARFGSPFVFEMRYIFTHEQNEISERFTAIADLEDGKEKTEKEFRILIDSLVRFAFSVEEGEALRKEFGTFSPRNVNLLRLAYSNFLRANNSGEIFL